MISNEELDKLVKRMKEIAQQPYDYAADYEVVYQLLVELKERRESDLRPAVKFMHLPLGKHIEKIYEEFGEVLIAALEDNEEHLREELVDLQMACETALARTGLDEQQRRGERRKVIAKDEARGYYDE